MADNYELQLVCNGNGNYEPIQSINKQFFCVDKDGYAITGYFDSGDNLNCEQYMYYNA